MLFFGPDETIDFGSVGTVDPLRQLNRSSGDFSGLIHILRVTDLIQLLNSTAQSGTLIIRDKEKSEAILIFAQGEIVQGQYGPHKGEEAVYAILSQEEGEFKFLQGNVPDPTHPIGVKTFSLLLEGCRRLDEVSFTQPEDTKKSSTTQIIPSAED